MILVMTIYNDFCSTTNSQFIDMDGLLFNIKFQSIAMINKYVIYKILLSACVSLPREVNSCCTPSHLS